MNALSRLLSMHEIVPSYSRNKVISFHFASYLIPSNESNADEHTTCYRRPIIFKKDAREKMKNNNSLVIFLNSGRGPWSP
jgi:maltose-binding protein MalE